MEKRIFYLDGIRVLAICLIIISHFNTHALDFAVSGDIIFWQRSAAIHHSFLGIMGVSLFIILSGASLTLSTQGGLRLATFYRKRWLAIFPLFWLTYAACFLALLLIHRHLPVNAPPLTFFLTLIGMDGFLVYAVPNFYLLGEWFLGFIIILYVIYPFLRMLFIKYPFLASAACLGLTAVVGKYYHLQMSVDRFPAFRVLEFFYGMAFISLFRQSSRILNGILCAIAGLLYYVSFDLAIPFPYSFVLQGMCVFTAVAGFFDLVSNRFFVQAVSFLGAYSYGAFLVHHIVLVEILTLLKDRHLTAASSYALFFALLAFIYLLSFVLTKVTALLVARIAGRKPVLLPAPGR